ASAGGPVRPVRGLLASPARHVPAAGARSGGYLADPRPGRRAAHTRARLAAADGDPVPLLLQEPQVGPPDRADGGGPAGLLGAGVELSQQRRPLARRPALRERLAAAGQASGLAGS